MSNLWAAETADVCDGPRFTTVRFISSSAVRNRFTPSCGVRAASA